jgi:hypothetical protein
MKICKLLLFLLPLCLLLTACTDEKSSSKPVSEIVTVPVTTKPLDTSKAENCVITAREETFTCTDKNKNTVKEKNSAEQQVKNKDSPTLKKSDGLFLC